MVDAAERKPPDPRFAFASEHKYLNVFGHPEEGEYAVDGNLWWDPDDPEAPCFGDTEMWDSYPEHRANLGALASAAVERREAALRRCRAVRLS